MANQSSENQVNQQAAPQGQPAQAGSLDELIFGDAQPQPNEFDAQVHEVSPDNVDPSSPQFLEQLGAQDQQGVSEGGQQESNPQPSGQQSQGQGEQEFINGQPVENIEKRYRYYQSQYDKLKNQVEPFMPLIEDIQQNPEMLAKLYDTNGAKATNATQTQEETLPEAPSRPEKPRTFSREEALTDPHSESAQYLEEMDEWQRDMTEYQVKRTEALEQRIEREKQEQRELEQKRRQAQQQRAQEQKQLSQVAQYAQQQYGLSEDAAVDFVQRYSDPSSLNIDTMLKMYMIETGQQVPTQSQQQYQPSQGFQQTQRAQASNRPLSSQQGVNNVRAPQPDQGKALTDSLVEGWKSDNPLEALMGA